MEAKHIKLMGVRHNQPELNNNEEIEEKSNYLPSGMNDILELNNLVLSNIEMDYMKFIVVKTN